MKSVLICASDDFWWFRVYYHYLGFGEGGGGHVGFEVLKSREFGYPTWRFMGHSNYL